MWNDHPVFVKQWSRSTWFQFQIFNHEHCFIQSNPNWLCCDLSSPKSSGVSKKFRAVHDWDFLIKFMYYYFKILKIDGLFNLSLHFRGLFIKFMYDGVFIPSFFFIILCKKSQHHSRIDLIFFMTGFLFEFFFKSVSLFIFKFPRH